MARTAKCEYYAQAFLELVEDPHDVLAEKYESAISEIYGTSIVFIAKARMFIESLSRMPIRFALMLPHLTSLPGRLALSAMTYDAYFGEFIEDMEECERKVDECARMSQAKWASGESRSTLMFLNDS